MEFILTLAYAILFFYFIRKSKFFSDDSFSKWLPGILFLLKCLSGVILGLIYTIYYTDHKETDTFKFFTDSKILFDSIYTHPKDFFRMLTGINDSSPELYTYYLKMDSWLNTNPFFNDNRTIIRLNAFFRFFSLGYYNVHVVFINFISFTGIYCLFKTFSIYCPGRKRELLIASFLMPSLMFWGSGVLKDGLLLSGFGLMIYSFTLLIKNGITAMRIIAFITGMIVLMMTKVYVIALILPGLFAWWLTRNSGKIKIISTFLIIYFIYFSIAFNTYHINPDYNLAALIFYKQKNFIDLGTIQKATMISIPLLECSAESVIKNSPAAFLTTMFRPTLSDVHGNPMILMAAVENLLIVIMILLCLFSLNTKQRKMEPFVLFCIIFIILLYMLIGLISPILGAIVRYKIVALPCLTFVLIYYSDSSKLMKRFSIIKQLKMEN
jgi:hypothetical protein